MSITPLLLDRTITLAQEYGATRLFFCYTVGFPKTARDFYLAYKEEEEGN